MLKNICAICSKPLKNGIIINGKVICNNCEQRIIRTQMNTDFYDYYKSKIGKSVMYCMIKRERERCNDCHL